jgi:hypothetical protein
MTIKEYIENLIEEYNKETKEVKTEEEMKDFYKRWDITIPKKKIVSEYTLDEFCKEYNVEKNKIEISILGNIIISNIEDEYSDIYTIKYEVDKENKIYINEISVVSVVEDALPPLFIAPFETLKQGAVHGKIKKYLESLGHETYNLTCTNLKLLLDGTISEEKFIEVIGDTC